MPITHLLPDKPQSFELLGQRIALWLDQERTPAAIADRCCHRSAQLSSGVVIDGNLRCPYHGWCFNSEGTCVQVPQLEKGSIPKTYQVQGYHCTERYDYVWVCLGEPLQPIPDIPEVADPTFRLIHEFYGTWNVGGLRCIENSFDSAHGNFIHASSWGDQKNPVVPPIDEIVDTDSGFLMKHWVEVLNPDLQKKNLGIQAEKTIRTNERSWFMPFDRQVTLEDRAVLETTDYNAPLAIAAEQHRASDKPGILMRHRLAALLKAHGEVEQRRED